MSKKRKVKKRRIVDPAPEQEVGEEDAPSPYYRQIAPSSLVKERKPGKRGRAKADEGWRKEWQGMPEFIQDDLQPWKTLSVHFKNQSDRDAFAKLIGQKLGLKTKWVWYPEVARMRFANKEYANES